MENDIEGFGKALRASMEDDATFKAALAAYAKEREVGECGVSPTAQAVLLYMDSYFEALRAYSDYVSTFEEHLTEIRAEVLRKKTKTRRTWSEIETEINGRGREWVHVLKILTEAKVISDAAAMRGDLNAATQLLMGSLHVVKARVDPEVDSTWGS